MSHKDLEKEMMEMMEMMERLTSQLVLKEQQLRQEDAGHQQQDTFEGFYGKWCGYVHERVVEKNHERVVEKNHGRVVFDLRKKKTKKLRTMKDHEGEKNRRFQGPRKGAKQR